MTNRYRWLERVLVALVLLMALLFMGLVIIYLSSAY